MQGSQATLNRAPRSTVSRAPVFGVRWTPPESRNRTWEIERAREIRCIRMTNARSRAMNGTRPPVAACSPWRPGAGEGSEVEELRCQVHSAQIWLGTRPLPLAPEFPIDTVRAIARHKVSGKFRRIMHKTNGRRPPKVSHFFKARLAPDASGHEINRHTMPSPVRPNSFKTKDRGHREPSHFLAGRYLEKGENPNAPA
jgi:hypothetical protein